jgi:hypothetical protein
MPVPKLAIDKKETEQEKSTRIGQSYKESKAGQMPDEKYLPRWGYNEELVKAGVILAVEVSIRARKVSESCSMVPTDL